MIIINIRTRLTKIVSLADYTPDELYRIYRFYKIHKDFTVLTNFKGVKK